MRIRTRTTFSGPVIELAGELDHDTAPEIRDLLPSLPIAHGQQLVVDLGGLTWCDSSGITVLIAARNIALWVPRTWVRARPPACGAASPGQQQHATSASTVRPTPASLSAALLPASSPTMSTTWPCVLRGHCGPRPPDCRRRLIG
ncbi:STAS domain-containing protein [Streptomyces sp. NPDC055105]|uniref:STAS domain-containing protein n=1 Tax=Streptomyces sp. NPDC055105 TaxID=3365719 RepID=UPI0037D905CC